MNAYENTARTCGTKVLERRNMHGGDPNVHGDVLAFLLRICRYLPVQGKEAEKPSKTSGGKEAKCWAELFGSLPQAGGTKLECRNDTTASLEEPRPCRGYEQ